MKEIDAGLLSAARMGERSGIQKWIDRGANIHAVNKRRQTALMLCWNVETLHWLLSEGVAIDARDAGDVQPYTKLRSGEIYRKFAYYCITAKMLTHGTTEGVQPYLQPQHGTSPRLYVCC